tara:strand:+ start:1687 stop:2085 length:399 start_codon:yes stop_codon:yes gene_type:complete
MATRCTVGYRNPDKTVNAVYCNWDGYPEHMVPAIRTFVASEGIDKFKSEIRRGQVEGGIRNFDHHEVQTYGDHSGDKTEGDEAWVTTMKDILQKKYQEYCYLVDTKTGEICSYYDWEGQKPLSEMERRVREG